MNESLSYSFQDAHNFMAKLNVKLKDIDPEQIPEEYKELILAQMELLLDKLG